QNYVSLDNPIGTHPADIRFVDSVSISISFWYKVASGNRHGDPPLISNKDWDSGSNEGLVLFNSGSGLQWNFREVDDGINSNTRKDSGGTSPGLEDNNWHHCVVVFNRAGNAGNSLETAAPVSNPAPLNPSIAVSGSNIVITKGNTMLFSAPSVNGPWTEVTAARSVSVYSEPLGPTKFYRGSQP